jgi:hypothetical protein
MLEGQRFAFTERVDSLGRSSILPYLPITLSNGNNSIEVMALLDTGASVNVLPKVARSRGIDYTDLIREWVIEKVRTA